MKYVIMIGDGMADRPLEELGGRTPLEVAATPNMDFVAREGALGLVRTVPPGLPCGSDVANMSIMGYDPASHYTGRSPLEAASIGVQIEANEVAFRCNLVTLDLLEGGAVMGDYSAGHIGTEDAKTLITILDWKLGSEEISFHPGFQYRHLMVWRGGEDGMETTPPHDITGSPIGQHLPKGPGADRLLGLMEASREILGYHPINISRYKRGQLPANSIWFWGQGKAPYIPPFSGKHGLTGAMVTAVDLLKGLAIYAGMEVIDVPGATGYLDTNYAGKVQGAIDALSRRDLVYLHVEAPDETGHLGNYRDKITAIEDFDSKVVGPVLEAVTRYDEFRVMVLPDHATPVSTRTHGPEPVPFAIYPRGEIPGVEGTGVGFTESWARQSRLFVGEGTALLPLFLGRA